MQRVQSARASQSLRECDDILECAEDEPAQEGPGGPQSSRLSRPQMDGDPLEDPISDMDDDHDGFERQQESECCKSCMRLLALS